MEENKHSNTFKMVIIPVIISAILSIIFTFAITNTTKNNNNSNSNISISNFKIESFNMDTEKNNYSYSEDSISYSGKGTVSCSDTQNAYFLIIEETNKKTSKKEYDYIFVHDGKGEFSTYDSSYSGATEKPEYEFNIIGFQVFNK